MTTVITRKKQIVAALGVLAAVFGVAACGGDGKSSNSDASAAPASATTTLPQGSEAVDLKPADFTTNIDNPYWPMSPGADGSTARRTPRGLTRRSSSTSPRRRR